jgi:hypothetical protein
VRADLRYLSILIIFPLIATNWFTMHGGEIGEAVLITCILISIFIIVKEILCEMYLLVISRY